MKKAVIVFSGFNQRAVIALLRTLEKNDVSYAIIAVSDQDTIFKTTYKNKVVATRKSVTLDIDDLTVAIKEVQRHNLGEEYLIAPSSEALNRYLLERRSVFETLNCEIPLTNNALYATISDKIRFKQLCEEYAISVPRDFDGIGNINFPLVVKPKFYQTKSGDIVSPTIVKSKAEFDEAMEGYDADDFYYQEFVSGDSLYLLYYFYEDGRCIKLSQQNLIQQAGGKSILAAVSSSFHENSESEKYEKMFTAVRFRGLVMVEIKRNGAQNYMIEANPRMWGPSQFFVDSGVNLFEHLLHDYGVLAQEPNENEVVRPRYFWYGGLMDNVMSGKKITYHSYGSDEYSREITEWMKADIYNREDTRDLFISEAGVYE